MSKFTIGDVVRVRGIEGPNTMVVALYAREDGSQKCQVVWFNPKFESSDEYFPEECLELVPVEPPQPDAVPAHNGGELLKAIATLQRDNMDLADRLARATTDRSGAVEFARKLLPNAVVGVGDVDARHAMSNVIGAHVTMKEEANAQLARMAERIRELETK